MTLRIGPHWLAGDRHLDSRVIPLLRMVAQEGSLNRAVARLKMSYRHAWGLLGSTESVLGRPLIQKVRGRGTRLTPFAEQLLDADDAASRLLSREFADALQALNTITERPGRASREKPLVV